MKKPALCVFLPYSQRDNVPSSANVLDVSSYAEFPYCTLSPLWVHGNIPVPGMPGKVSDSVEGIWQGLKLVRGKTALHLFRGKGKKRGGGKPSGHLFGKAKLNYTEARYKIYLPTYEWVLQNRVDSELIAQLLGTARAGITQYIHDTADNGDLNNTEAPLAHASLLVRFLNRMLNAAMIDPG